MRFLRAFLIICVCSGFCHGQFLSAYQDQFGRTKVFDNGMFRHVHHLPMLEYVAGWSAIAFTDHWQQINIFHNEKLISLPAGGDVEMLGSKHFIILDMPVGLYLVDKGKLTNLHPEPIDNFRFGDSIVAYENRFGGFEVYWKGMKHELEIEMPVSFECGSNCVAYVTKSGDFKFFSEGVTHFLDAGIGACYLVGTNLVAYRNEYRDEVLWSDGSSQSFDEDSVRFVKLGDGFAVCKDWEGNFKVWNNGRLDTLMTGWPRRYIIKHKVLAYENEFGSLVAYFGGLETVLATRWPEHIELEGSMVAWLNNDNIVQAMVEGHVHTISQGAVSDFGIDGQVIRFVYPTGKVGFWCKGKVYNSPT